MDVYIIIASEGVYGDHSEWINSIHPDEATARSKWISLFGEITRLDPRAKSGWAWSTRHSADYTIAHWTETGEVEYNGSYTSEDFTNWILAYHQGQNNG